MIGKGQGDALGWRGLVPDLLEEGGVVRKDNHLGAVPRDLGYLVNSLTPAECVLAVDGVVEHNGLVG